MKIAVIGSGISGIGAAYYLAQRHDVTLFERDERAGGHTNTVTVPTPGGGLAIDTGFIVCNPVNYPNFYRFLDELGVRRQDTDMSLGVSVEDGRIEWAGGKDLSRIFAQPSLALRGSHWRMLLAVLRFNSHVKHLLAGNRLPDITLGEFLERHHYPMELRVRYVAAMAGPIWSTSTRGVMDFPFPAFARFFESHGLLSVTQQPQWQTVCGGSRQYVEQALVRFRGQLRLNTPVRQLQRERGGLSLLSDAGEERYDAAVCAIHSDQALSLLTDACEAECSLLANVPYTANIAYLHTDETLMPRRRRAWASWNALLAQDRLSDEPIGVSYWMNLLQNVDTATQYFVSLNPPRPPRAGTVLYQTRYEHPLYTPATIAAQERLHEIQGRNRIWWAGAWTGYGFHEDGFKSGLRAVAGIDPSCLPPWASGLRGEALPTPPAAAEGVPGLDEQGLAEPA